MPPEMVAIVLLVEAVVGARLVAQLPLTRAERLALAQEAKLLR